MEAYTKAFDNRIDRFPEEGRVEIHHFRQIRVFAEIVELAAVKVIVDSESCPVLPDLSGEDEDSADASNLEEARPVVHHLPMMTVQTVIESGAIGD